jgi:hypothetical protein
MIQHRSLQNRLRSLLRPEGPPQVFFNGIDADRGTYLVPPSSAEELADLSQRDQGDPGVLAQLRHLVLNVFHRGTTRTLRDGLDDRRLDQCGWGLVLPAGDNEEAILAALRPLLEHRKQQAGPELYREIRGEDGYRQGETSRAFLQRLGAGPYPIEPTQVPYYLLLAGDPQSIPFEFEFYLQVSHAVGRLCFDKIEDYARYAESVVAAERGAPALPRTAALFATANPDDPATAWSADRLIRPLSRWLSAKQQGWRVQSELGTSATRDRLGSILHAGPSPALLFTASHGIAFELGDERQEAQQGALICQDWPGPLAAHGVSREHYFSGEDLAATADVHGLVAFLFACHGAGTPRHSDLPPGNAQRPIARHSFVARLPQRLLAHPRGGALAVVSHVDAAYGFSFNWPNLEEDQLTLYQGLLGRLSEGRPVGAALQPFGQQFAALSVYLDEEQRAMAAGKSRDDKRLLYLQYARLDARNFTLLGDPAVRLCSTDPQ